MVIRSVTIVFLFLFSGVCNCQDILTGTAINIYDGDTFTLLQSNGNKTKIRVVGIDAPEAKQEYGITARDYARKLLEGKQLTVYLEPGETYGRKLGVVITDAGIHFNYEMVAGGYAWWYDQFSDDKYLEVAYKKARNEKKGLWANQNAEAPWDWRRQNKGK